MNLFRDLGWSRLVPSGRLHQSPLSLPAKESINSSNSIRQAQSHESFITAPELGTPTVQAPEEDPLQNLSPRPEPTSPHLSSPPSPKTASRHKSVAHLLEGKEYQDIGASNNIETSQPSPTPAIELTDPLGEPGRLQSIMSDTISAPMDSASESKKASVPVTAPPSVTPTTGDTDPVIETSTPMGKVPASGTAPIPDAPKDSSIPNGIPVAAPEAPVAAIPDAPGVPNVPEVSAIPEAPSIPAIPEVPAVPGVPTDITGLAPVPATPQKRRGKRAKVKEMGKKVVRKSRKLILRKKILTIPLGRHLAGPVADLLRSAAAGVPIDAAADVLNNAPVDLSVPI